MFARFAGSAVLGLGVVVPVGLSTSTMEASACCEAAPFVNRGPTSLIDSVGNTPLIRLNVLSKATGCEIYGKAEYLNPSGSIKDRAAKFIIEDKIKTGELKPGGTIVEGTGGNTGVALAMLGASMGYKVGDAVRIPLQLASQEEPRQTPRQTPL